MNTSDTFKSPEKFVARLRRLHGKRKRNRLKLRGEVVRKSLSVEQRKVIHAKTAGRCHICGGKVEDRWDADHVFSHSKGGPHEADNYLPAHPTCNGYRKAYEAEELQWILKLGVWLRTQIEKETDIGKKAAEAFCAHEKKRAARTMK